MTNDAKAPDNAEIWNGTGGRTWVELQPMLDSMVLPIGERLRAMVEKHGPARVLDIGCGGGATSLAASEAMGPEGTVTGVDISAPLVELAQERAAARTLPVTFICADAETYDFGEARYDLFISRFGVMFFDDPLAAMRNLRGVAAEGAKLEFYAWRDPAENPFMTLAGRTARPYLPDLPRYEPDAPGQFGFANAERVANILNEAGWRDIAIDPVDEELGLPADKMRTFLMRMGPVGNMLSELDGDRREEILGKLEEAFASYVDGDQVRYDAALWRIRARV